MAVIHFSMNNLDIQLSGVSGYMDECTYTNLDPVTYVYRSVNTMTGQVAVFHFLANTTAPTPLAGFRRQKTDETELSFLGAIFPS